VVAAGARHYCVRPIRPDDKLLIVEGLRRMSERSRYFRFMAPTDGLSRVQLGYLSEVDFRDHVAWGVVERGDPIAVGRFVRFPEDPRAADVAVSVVDDRHRRGIGRMLVQVLATSARLRGVERMSFDVLAENTAMLGLLRSMGADMGSRFDPIQAVLRVDTVPEPDVVDGDLAVLLDAAAQRASASSSRAAEFTQ
jgi:ribosomal protein S18 acetylase RimI-like enzyme